MASRRDVSVDDVLLQDVRAVVGVLEGSYSPEGLPREEQSGAHDDDTDDRQGESTRILTETSQPTLPTPRATTAIP
jgi:hypothetical protein